MATLKLKTPMASGKFNVIFHKNKVYNYTNSEDGKVLVQHDTNLDAIVPFFKKDVTIID